MACLDMTIQKGESEVITINATKLFCKSNDNDPIITFEHAKYTIGLATYKSLITPYTSFNIANIHNIDLIPAIPLNIFWLL